MIQTLTLLNVADNSGAKVIQCIKTLKESKRNNAQIGEIIVASIKKITTKTTINTKKIKKVKKGQVVYALIIRTKKELNRKNGTFVKFNNNAAILISKANLPIGTRIFGPITHELRKEKFMKIVSLASSIV